MFKRGLFKSTTVLLLICVAVGISLISFITYSYVSSPSTPIDPLNSSQNTGVQNTATPSINTSTTQPRVTGSGGSPSSGGSSSGGGGGGGSGSGGDDGSGGTASNQDPIAVLDATPSSGSVPLTVFFNANRSTDPENLPLSYNWTWFNGTAQLNDTNQSFGYTFRHAGEFAANLTVTDAGGAQSHTSIYIVVNSVCSNGVQELLEQCDGSDLDGLSCTTYPNGGFTGGSLSCTSACTFNTTSCTTTLPDTTPPQFSGYSESPVTYNSGQTTISVTISDNVAVDKARLVFNGQTYLNPSKSGNTYTQIVGSLSAGSYSYQWFANDTAGNTNQTNSRIYILAKDSPSLSLQLTPSASITQGTQSTATGTGCPAGLTCILRRGASTVSNPDTQTLAVGSYVYNYSTVGNANYSSASIIQTLLVNSPIDTTAPLVTITSPLNQTYTSSTLTYSVQLNEAGVVNYSIDGGPNITMTDSGGNTFSATGSSLSNGAHVFRVAAMDASGNRNSSARVSFSVNTATLPTGLCVVSDTSFQNYALPSQTSSFTFIVNATPTSAASDSLLMLADHDVAAFTDAAVIVRFNNANTIDARNGGAYAATNTIGYTAGTSYIFRLVVNPVAKTYSVFVTPQGGSEQTLATNFAFRTEQASVSTITRFALSSTSGGANVCDPRVNGNALNTCGNTQIEFGEVCDTSSQACTLGGYSGTASCNAQCTGINTCNIGSQACGDGIINGAESCDGAQLGGQSCTGLGFTSGSLSCSGSCTFNTASCVGAPSQACKNTLDDDSDGLVDMDDPGCADPSDTSEANTGAVYYVCNTGGNDANAGTNKNAPWASFAKAKTQFTSLAAGGSILFCKGGTFTATESSAGAWNNGACTATNPCMMGSYTPTSGATTKPIITSTFAGSDGSNAIITLQQNHHGYIFRNLQLINGASTNNAIWILGSGVSHITMDGLVVDGFTTQGIIAQQGPTDIIVRNSLIQNVQGRQGFFGGGDNYLIENNTFLFNGGVQGDHDHNLYVAAGGSGIPFRNVTIRNNYLRGSAATTGRCVGVEIVVHGHASDLLIEGNYIDDTGIANGGCWGIAVDTGHDEPDESFTRTIIRGNTIINSGNTGIVIDSCPHCTIENNVIIGTEEGGMNGIVANSGSNVANQNITIRHNSVLLLKDESSGIVVGQASGSTNRLYGNSIYYKGTNGAFECFSSTPASSAYSVFDYNNCYAPNLGSVTWMNSQSLSAWQSASGKDANSFVGNPLFSSITSPNYNLLPQSGSPLIDKVPLALAPLKDIRGGERPAGALADIGAYEFGAQLGPLAASAGNSESSNENEGSVMGQFIQFLSNFFSGTLFNSTQNSITGNVVNDYSQQNSTSETRIYF